MELQEKTGGSMSGTVRCPECDNDIPVDPAFREGDTFVCPNCSAGLLITGLEPLWVDFVRNTEEDWAEPERRGPLSLEEVEKLEDAESGTLDDRETWADSVPRRVATLRVAGARSQPQKEAQDVEDDRAVYLTPEGSAKLRQELEQLKTVRLPRAISWLSDALSEGFEDEDVTELEEARSQLAFVEGRIRRIEDLLASARFLPEPKSADCVQLGSRVTVAEGEQEPETYRVVGPAEADPLTGSISHVSPLGKALMGRYTGDLVVVESPEGPIEFRILAIG